MKVARRWFGYALGMLLAACSSPNPNLYTIAPVPGQVAQSGAPGVVLVRDVSVAHYLERSQIVRSSDNYRLDVMSNDWWGEPMGAMLNRVLVDELSARLPRSTVASEAGLGGVTPGATVEVNVSRLDEDARGELVLQGQTTVTKHGQREPVLRSFRFAVMPSRPGTPGEVAAISTAVGQLADMIATMVATGPAR
jgi:uncharacterized protein